MLCDSHHCPALDSSRGRGVAEGESAEGHECAGDDAYGTLVSQVRIRREHCWDDRVGEECERMSWIG